MQQNILDSQLSRILHSTTSNDLVKQIKQCNTYQLRIEEQFMKKTNQISKLQNYLKDQISNIQKIVEQNNKLKKENQNQVKLIMMKTQENCALTNDLKANVRMNGQLRQIIKRLQDRALQLQNENMILHQKQMKQQSIQTENIDQIQNEKYISDLLNKISALQDEAHLLKSQKQYLMNQISQQKLNNFHQYSSINENEQMLVEENRLTTDEILMMISQDSLKEIAFRGEILNGLKEGHGVCQYTDTIIYQGQFHQGKRHGLGQITIYDQLIYRGFWKNDIMDGKGILHMLQGEIVSYEGNFHEGRLQGYGHMKLKSGKRIIGQWRDGKINGNCIQIVGKTKKYIKPELIQCY